MGGRGSETDPIFPEASEPVTSLVLPPGIDEAKAAAGLRTKPGQRGASDARRDFEGARRGCRD
jgi:hypothetical protein